MYPSEAEEKLWNRTLTAYEAGSESLGTVEDPKDYNKYVKDCKSMKTVRKIITDKPWGR